MPAQIPPREFLERMDANCVFAQAEHTRHVEHGEVVERDGVTLLWTPRGDAIHNLGMIRAAVDPDELCRAVHDVYTARGRTRFALYLRGHADGELEKQLLERGFATAFSAPAMTVDRAGFRPPPPVAGLEVRPVETESDVTAYAEVAAHAFNVYGVPLDTVRAFFSRPASLRNESVQGFVAWHGGEAVACATLYASHLVAGVGWVGTRPDRFGRGYAACATAAVVEEGFRRGLLFANLQASPMGVPVYARLGFGTPGRYKILVPATLLGPQPKS